MAISATTFRRHADIGIDTVYSGIVTKTGILNSLGGSALLHFINTTGVGLSSGNVGSWIDQSGAGNNANMPFVANQPSYNSVTNQIRFGTNNTLSLQYPLLNLNNRTTTQIVEYNGTALYMNKKPSVSTGTVPSNIFLYPYEATINILGTAPINQLTGLPVSINIATGYTKILVISTFNNTTGINYVDIYELNGTHQAIVHDIGRSDVTMSTDAFGYWDTGANAPAVHPPDDYYGLEFAVFDRAFSATDKTNAFNYFSSVYI